MGKYFGTDGFRGEANKTLTSDHAYRIGRFLGWYYSSPLSGCTDKNHKTRIVIGKDTRRSSYMFEYSIVAGLTASGADAYMLHVTTTPSVSFVTHREDFDCGIMISASHNPFYDNGIKLVNSNGEKIDDQTIEIIERYMDGGARALGLDMDELPLATGENVGRIVDHAAGRNRYVGYLISLAAHSYKDFRVGLDCANGASWMIAKAVFEALGAKTYVINAQPDGVNINTNAGSTHIDVLRKFVVEQQLDVGFAFDGDADRCIAVDEKGNEVNGDHILYVLGLAMKQQGALTNNTVVTTIMSNMGLYRALSAAGMDYVQTTVGDRFVYENMVENGHCIGGEQSGHIILKKYATTGDGLLTAIMVMEQIVESKLPLSKLAEAVVMYPQVCRSVRVASKDAVIEHPEVRARLEASNARLGADGRMLLRKSGTEPVIRVMAEAKTEEMCEELVADMLSLIRSLGLSEE
ncbi:MAG: phosphoglucosamine mutase [Ruminococcaceae bacterium]|nr:phosphoglucosamine mutase [Oscillospiraceae bacterium]